MYYVYESVYEKIELLVAYFRILEKKQQKKTWRMYLLLTAVYSDTYTIIPTPFSATPLFPGTRLWKSRAAHRL